MKTPWQVTLVALSSPLAAGFLWQEQPQEAPPVLALAAPADSDGLPGLQQLMGLQEHLVEVHDRLAPSIVAVTAFERIEGGAVEAGAPQATPAAWSLELERSYPGFRRAGSGSGVVLTAEGDILTNRHFLLKADGSPVDLVDVETVDNRHTICRIVGMEPTLNMAILKLEVYSRQNPPRFEAVPMGNSAAIEPGHLAFAMGDPYGPEKMFTTGVFASTPSRECYQEQRTATYLQVSMQAHPGAYGGALLNLRGEYIGMLTPRDPLLEESSVRHVGLEFALPSNIIRGIFTTIKRNESFASPWLGIAVMSMGELHRELGAETYLALARPRQGIYVENVFEPSPAAAAGVRPGDFLVRFGGVVLGSPIDFQRQLYMAEIGGSATLEFYRDGEPYTREVPVELRPARATTR